MTTNRQANEREKLWLKQVWVAEQGLFYKITANKAEQESGQTAGTRVSNYMNAGREWSVYVISSRYEIEVASF